VANKRRGARNTSLPLLVAITGASGVVYGVELLRVIDLIRELKKI